MGLNYSTVLVLLVYDRVRSYSQLQMHLCSVLLNRQGPRTYEYVPVRRQYQICFSAIAACSS